MGEYKRLSPEDVRMEVWGLKSLADEPGSASPHEREDEIHRMVLKAIADGTCTDPKQCAAEALKTSDIDFSRWYE